LRAKLGPTIAISGRGILSISIAPGCSASSGTGARKRVEHTSRRAICRNGGSQVVSYELSLPVLELMIKREENAFILSAFTPVKRPDASPQLVLVDLLPMDTHNAATSGNLSV
jgi:hypothetical protein